VCFPMMQVRVLCVLLVFGGFMNQQIEALWVVFTPYNPLGISLVQQHYPVHGLDEGLAQHTTLLTGDNSTLRPTHHGFPHLSGTIRSAAVGNVSQKEKPWRGVEPPGFMNRILLFMDCNAAARCSYFHLDARGSTNEPFILWTYGSGLGANSKPIAANAAAQTK
jgi:hypothetical protein